MRKAVWWGGGALVLALIGMFVASMLNQPSDKQLILQALDESIAASRAGRPGGVLEYLSRNLTWNGDEGVNRMEIADYIKRAKPEVTVMHREVVLDGDTATITTPVNVKLSMLGQSMDETLDRVTITFAAESGTKNLIIPVRKWRIIKVDVEGGFTPPY